MDYDGILFAVLLLYGLAIPLGVLGSLVLIVMSWKRPGKPNNQAFWRDDFPPVLAWSGGILLSTIVFNILYEGIPRIRWGFQLWVLGFILAFWLFVAVGGGLATFVIGPRYKVVVKRAKRSIGTHR